MLLLKRYIVGMILFPLFQKNRYQKCIFQIVLNIDVNKAMVTEQSLTNVDNSKRCQRNVFLFIIFVKKNKIRNTGDILIFLYIN